MTPATLGTRVTLGKSIAWLLTLLLAMISVAPILWIVVTSFKTFIQTQAIPPVWPSFTDVENYVSQFSGSNSALGPLLRSLVVATVTMVITIVVAVPAAYSLARYRIFRKQDVQFWIISSRMMPLIAGSRREADRLGERLQLRRHRRHHAEHSGFSGTGHATACPTPRTWCTGLHIDPPSAPSSWKPRTTRRA